VQRSGDRSWGQTVEEDVIAICACAACEAGDKKGSIVKQDDAKGEWVVRHAIVDIRHHSGRVLTF